MASAKTPEPLTAEAAGRLAEFARACKAAIRIVAMYPPTHPAIQGALDRMVAAGTAATSDGPLTITVRPDTLLVGGRGMPRPEAAVDELAVMLHAHQVGEVTLLAPLTGGAWHLLLTLLATPPDELRATGGIARAWESAGGGPAVIREIDYGEILKDRGAAAGGAGWDDLLATCLAGDDSTALDDQTLASLLDIARSPERLGEFLQRLQNRARGAGQPPETVRQTLRRLLQALADHAVRCAPDEFDVLMDHMASGAARLTPDLLIALLPAEGGAGSPADEGVDLAGELRARFSEEKLAAFVAENIIRDRGATSRLAEAFHALAPTEAQRRTALALAEERVLASPLGDDPRFTDLWSQALSVLLSYSDRDYVPDAYGRELNAARGRAVEIEQTRDDPPDRIAAWLATVGDQDLRALDQQLLVDLLKIEDRADAWSVVLDMAMARLDQLLLVGDLPLSAELAGAVTGIAADPGSTFQAAARTAVERLLDGPLAARLMPLIRGLPEEEMPRVSAVCRAFGPAVVRPLVAALAEEESRLAVRRARDVLIGFGPAVREPARTLRQSGNPAVRRAAIEILRTVGGDEVLADLAALLADTDPHVQREAVRALLQIGSSDAFATLEAAVTTGDPSVRQAVVQALGSVADERAAPLVMQLLERSTWRGRTAEAGYTALIDALGRSGTSPRAVALLEHILHRGEWWAPRRSARIRAAAARALHAMASPASEAALERAMARGSRGVREAAARAAAAPRPARRAGDEA